MVPLRLIMTRRTVSVSLVRTPERIVGISAPTKYCPGGIWTFRPKVSVVAPLTLFHSPAYTRSWLFVRLTPTIRTVTRRVPARDDQRGPAVTGQADGATAAPMSMMSISARAAIAASRRIRSARCLRGGRRSW